MDAYMPIVPNHLVIKNDKEIYDQIWEKLASMHITERQTFHYQMIAVQMN